MLSSAAFMVEITGAKQEYNNLHRNCPDLLKIQNYFLHDCSYGNPRFLNFFVIYSLTTIAYNEKKSSIEFELEGKITKIQKIFLCRLASSFCATIVSTFLRSNCYYAEFILCLLPLQTLPLIKGLTSPVRSFSFFCITRDLINFGIC